MVLDNTNRLLRILGRIFRCKVQVCLLLAKKMMNKGIPKLLSVYFVVKTKGLSVIHPPFKRKTQTIYKLYVLFKGIDALCKPV